VVTNVVGQIDTISIYAGMIWMDIQCEASIVSDPDVLLDGFEAEATAFRELCTEAVDGSRRDPLAERKRRLTRGVR
jgi:hypothetical protein